MICSKSKSVLLVGSFRSHTGAYHGVGDDLAKHLRVAGWCVVTTSNKQGRLPRFLDMLRTTWCKRRKYAVAEVEVYSGRAFLWAESVCFLLRKACKPYVLTLHGGNLSDYVRRFPGRAKRLLDSGAAVTTPSGFLRDAISQFRTDLQVIPNALDLCLYPFHLRERARPRLVWLRAFHEIYNPALAPRVMAELTGDYPDSLLCMIGPDKRDGSLQATEQLAREFGVHGRISFPGGVPKSAVPEWLQSGDVFINTTNIDNTPVSVLEAMACGLCVVSTNVGGIPYLLVHEKDALLVPPDDPEAMAAAVRRIFTEPGLAAHLSANARSKAEQFDWSVVLPKWEQLLQHVMNHA